MSRIRTLLTSVIGIKMAIPNKRSETIKYGSLNLTRRRHPILSEHDENL